MTQCTETSIIYNCSGKLQKKPPCYTSYLPQPLLYNRTKRGTWGLRLYKDVCTEIKHSTPLKTRQVDELAELAGRWEGWAPASAVALPGREGCGGRFPSSSWMAAGPKQPRNASLGFLANNPQVERGQTPPPPHSHQCRGWMRCCGICFCTEFPPLALTTVTATSREVAATSREVAAGGGMRSPQQRCAAAGQTCPPAGPRAPAETPLPAGSA